MAMAHRIWKLTEVGFHMPFAFVCDHAVQVIDDLRLTLTIEPEHSKQVAEKVAELLRDVTENL